MASPNSINPCIKCLEGSGQVVCGGCHQWLCLKHFGEHRQDFAQQMEYLSKQHNQLRQKSAEDHDDENFHQLISRIDQWEKKSIERIRRVADEVRQKLRESIDQTKRNIGESLKDISKALQESQVAENYTEIDLNKWVDRLNQIREQLDRPMALTIVHDQDEATTSIPLIELHMKEIIDLPLITPTSKWSRTGRTVAGGYEHGNALHQLHYPYDLYIDHAGIIFITDSDNHRILKWKSHAYDGEMVIGKKGRGDQTDQLNLPAALLIDQSKNCLIISEYGNRRVMRWSLNQDGQDHIHGQLMISNIVALGLALDDEGSLYVSDYEKHEVRRYERGNDRSGVIVAGGHGQGAALNQLNSPRHIFVDHEFSLYISDSDNHRVMKWKRHAREGVVVAGGHGQGNSLKQLNRPNGIFVDSKGSVYVVDQRNSRVMRWLCEETEGEVIVGGNGHGSQKNQLHQPANFSMDQKGNLYVVDTSNHRIQRFDILSPS